VICFFRPRRADPYRAERETALSGCASRVGLETLEKGAHGGDMVSPVAKRPDRVGIPVAGIERLMHQAAEAL
jgi:hypothetical protein